MQDVFSRIADNMVSRVSGPMNLRLLLQPAMAILFAVIAGIKDAKAGRPPYFWSLFFHTDERRDIVRDGWGSVGKVFLMAILIDCVYQLIVQRWVYPLEAVLVGIILAILPYLIVRGPVNRIA